MSAESLFKIIKEREIRNKNIKTVNKMNYFYVAKIGTS